PPRKIASSSTSPRAVDAGPRRSAAVACGNARDGRCADWSIPVGHGGFIAHPTGPVKWPGSALRTAELGDDPVPVATIDRLDVLDRPAVLIAARPLEEERR